MAKYEIDAGAQFHRKERANAQKIGNELDRLTRENAGRLKPEHVVEAARNRKSILHVHFEWSDRVAAEKYRLDQARELIRSVKIIGTTEDHRAIRAYYSIQDDGRAYRSVSEVMSTISIQQQLHKMALADLKAFTARYREISSLCVLITPVIEHAEVLVTNLLRQIEVEAARVGGAETRPH